MKYNKRQLSFDDARIHATRCFGKMCCAPCNTPDVWEANRPGFTGGTCPVTDIPAQNVAFAQDNEDARTMEWWRHKFNNVLHIITGYSCNAPCMDGPGCVTQHIEKSRAEGNEMDGDPEMLGQPVSIREIELAFSEWGYKKGLERRFEETKKESVGRKAVVIGSSVAGLTAGIRLLWEGWDVEVISVDHLGLMMAIPDDHLPYEIANRPAEQFTRMGGVFTQGKVVSSEEKAADPQNEQLFTPAEVQARGDVLILAPGTNPRELDVPGADLDGVIQTIPFLISEKRKRAGLDHRAYTLRGNRCLHYGAGDTAHDGARTVQFLINDITNVSLAVRSELAKEQAKGWGVETHPKHWISTTPALGGSFGNTVIKELKGQNGKLGAAVLHDRVTGQTKTVEIDHLFLSMGGLVGKQPWDELGVRLEDGVLAVDESGWTGVPGVYACGDAVLKSHRVFPYVIETANKVVAAVKAKANPRMAEQVAS